MVWLLDVPSAYQAKRLAVTDIKVPGMHTLPHLRLSYSGSPADTGQY